MLRFNKNYFLLTLLLFIIELLIGVFVHDTIIRPYIGDMLVVVLIYCFIKSFCNTPVVATATAVLIFSFTVEILQYFKVVEILGLQNSKIARIIIGSSFSWMDMLMYAIGIVLVLWAEKKCTRK
jgi:DNA integrity scanning protein DisA with diadenylate cyclase activity